MPSIDENSNMTNGHDDTEIGYKRCTCCPFGYHIYIDFVPFSEKMLSREGNVQRIQALKDKWRSERQSMDKLLGIPIEPWEVKTLSRPNRDIWEFESSYCSLSLELPTCASPLELAEGLNFAFGPDLDQAVVEFEDVLARAKRPHNKTFYTLPDDHKFHTFPRPKGTGRDGEFHAKSRIPLVPTTTGLVSHNKENGDLPTSIPVEKLTKSVSTITEDNYSTQRFREAEWIQGLEEKVKLIPKLQATLEKLTKENKNYLDLLSGESKKRRMLEDKMNPRNAVVPKTLLVEGEKGILGRKHTKNVSVGATVSTRDFGVGNIQADTRSIGVGGRVDTSNFERDSSSPTGSLNGRRRGRTFETGIQVNESELLDKDPPPPLLLITEKHDFGGQADFDQILTPKSGYTDLLYHQMGIPKVVTSTGILVKPTTSERGMLFKPITRDEASNTTIPETLQKCVGTMSYVSNEESGDAKKVQSVTELKTIGVNTADGQVSKATASTTTTMTTDSIAAQTDAIRKHDVGIQMEDKSTSSTTLEPRKMANVPGITSSSESMESSSSSLLTAHRSPTHPFLPGSMLVVYEEESSRTPSTEFTLSETSIGRLASRPALVRSNTYTKDIPSDEEESYDEGNHEEYVEMAPISESKYVPATPFDLSITTILERREAVKPSKEMQGALKVLNDALLRGKTTEHVTNAIGIILHEWFRVSGSKSANAHDVEDYLDLYESYSPELLKYIVNMPDGNGNSAIHYAVSHGNFDVVSVLLDSNCCDINRANKAGYTCIMLLSLAKLSYETDRHVVCRLCDMGDVNIKATQHGQTALMLAASHGRLETCHILLDAGADINIKDDDGSTALMCAAEHGHVELVNYFVTLPDCDLHITDNDGSTALNVAMEANHKDVGVTLYAHMHLVESPKSEYRRLSYPPSSPLTSTASSPLPTRSAGNSPDTKKKLGESTYTGTKKRDATESPIPQ